jgi:hypothetical protein
MGTKGKGFKLEEEVGLSVQMMIVDYMERKIGVFEFSYFLCFPCKGFLGFFYMCLLKLEEVCFKFSLQMLQLFFWIFCFKQLVRAKCVRPAEQS